MLAPQRRFPAARKSMTTAAQPLPRRHTITVEDYYRMGETGILPPDARVELVEGEIIDVPPIGPSHASVVKRLNQVFVRTTAGAAVASVQDPVRLSELSEPQPDLALLRYREDFYAASHPTPDDVLLLVEVADTTLSYDRDSKIPLYARSGIPEVWLIDINSRHLDVYRHPDEGRYTTQFRAGDMAALEVEGLPECRFDLSGVL